ncbi:ureidoglycolate lyase [Rhodoferax sp. OV413]|uniref:ureidoglycolate lyase n=1 Tax=Rhodoferax sp. OV413 TaxID=1855285 RepID=UPI000888BBF3|nr:ureidoglycolate lyase [Rhodoferax sp. OV413]SDN98387.1 ureidoglycolate lyase [Rhodoferax sp. OV413]
MPSSTLPIEPLTAEAFRPFGDVIEASDSARHFSINDGFAERYHDLAQIDVGSLGGRAILSIFKALPRSLPMQLVLLERHPLGSQAFMPLSALPYLVVVAEAGPVPQLSAIRCFRAAPGQGVNYARGTWHHPLIALHQASDFLAVDRGGAPGDANCDEHPLGDTPIWIE